MLRKLGGETSVHSQRSSDPQHLSPAAAITRRHDRDRFQTALFAPAARREALFALYAFNYQIARVREAVTQPMLGRIRLQWWRENIAAAYENTPVRRNDIVEALTVAIRERALTRVHFDRLIDAREADFDEDPPASLAALEAYAEGTSSQLVLSRARGPGRERPCRERGRASYRDRLCAGRPAAGGAVADRGRAADHSGRHYRAHRARFWRSSGAAWFDALRAAVAEIAAAAEGHLRAARELRRAVARAALPALLPAVVAERSLTRLRGTGYDPFDPALVQRDPLQSWRLAAAALRHRF